MDINLESIPTFVVCACVLWNFAIYFSCFGIEHGDFEFVHFERWLDDEVGIFSLLYGKHVASRIEDEGSEEDNDDEEEDEIVEELIDLLNDSDGKKKRDAILNRYK